MANEANVLRSNTNGVPLEKDFSPSHQNGHGDLHLGADVDSQTALHRIRTAGSISISPELFEKIYLSPQNAVKGDLRKTFGNPTPIALLGFVMSLTPLSCTLMGWRGAGGSGTALNGVFFFMGGVLMILGGTLDFFLGNTFPFVVFCSFGGFWLAFGATVTQSFNTYSFYSTDASNPAAGLQSAEFAATFAYFMVFMGLLCFIYMICALRTNVVFLGIFVSLVLCFGLLAGSYWQAANGAASLAGRLQTAAGAWGFITSLLGWYIFFALMLAALDFPFQVPVGDLSRFIKGGSERLKEKRVRQEGQHEHSV